MTFREDRRRFGPHVVLRATPLEGGARGAASGGSDRLVGRSSADGYRARPGGESGPHPAQAAQSGGDPGAPGHPDGIFPRPGITAAADTRQVGGNPLFALELAAGAHANSLSGLLDTVRMPDSLRRLVLERVTLLPPGSRDVLLVRPLSTETALLAICAAASNPATAHTDLEVGIRAGLLTVADGDVAFVHPLMRSVVAEDASPSVRRAAHRRLAAAVRGPEARARHLAFGAERLGRGGRERARGCGPRGSPPRSLRHGS